MKGRFPRYNKSNPCPICLGYPQLPQGRGIRCTGFALNFVAYCARPELAGRLDLDSSVQPAAYKHLLFGDCRCGKQHGGPRPSERNSERGPSARLRRSDERSLLPIEMRSAVFELLLDSLELENDALADLTRRGLSGEEIARQKYRSMPGAGQADWALANLTARFDVAVLRQSPGFVMYDRRLHVWLPKDVDRGYYVPFRDAEGRITGMQIKQLGGKYFTLYRTQFSSVYHLAGRRQSELFVTEGGLKATVASHLGAYWCLGLPGQSLAPEHIDLIRELQPESILIALDQEVNPQTDIMREKWRDALLDAGLNVFEAVWDRD